MKDSNRVEFLASIPPLQSALTVAGDGGARLKLDLDEMQMNVITELLALRGELLRVTIEVIPHTRPVVQEPEIVGWKQPKPLKS